MKMIGKTLSTIFLTTVLGFSALMFPGLVMPSMAMGFSTSDLDAPDCNDPDFYDIGCPEPTKALIDQLHAAGYPYYIGHDEVSTQFFSSSPGSGFNMQWKIQLPSTEPSPAQDGSSVANFELYGAFWIGLALCDPDSYPFGACIADSDTNDASTAGSALMELQFYPPGSPFRPSAFCPDSQWCARLETFILETNPSCPGVRPQTAFITTDGTVGGPRLLMSNGDNILITIQDTPSGLETAIEDLATSTTGVMVAGSANGFIHIDPTTCTTTPFDFHPMFDTASPGNGVPWTAFLANVNFVFEIGHWELCGDPACSVLPDGGDADDVGCQTIRGIGGCIALGTTDLDFDGISYQEDWPDGTAAHPSTLVIKAPSSDIGVGPRSFDGTSYSENYNTIHFARTQSATGASFYPFYSRGEGFLCHFNFGNDIPGITNDDFGKTLQYGTTIANPCPPSVVPAPFPNIDITEPNDLNNRQQAEPTIAVDPSSPNIIVAGAQDYRLLPEGGHRWHGYYRSTNDGLTWSISLLPGFPGDASPEGLASPLKAFNTLTDPVLAFDRSGNVYYVGLAFNSIGPPPGTPVLGSDRIFVARYVDHGATYDGATLIGTAGADKPWIAVDNTGGPNDGNVYVTYYDLASSTVFAHSPGGVDWQDFSPPIFIGFGAYKHGVAVDTTGNIFVSFIDGGDILVSKSTDGGITFPITTTAASGIVESPFSGLPSNDFRTPTIPQISTDSAGVYVVWNDYGTGDTDVFLVRSTDGGGSWSSPLRINDVTTNQQFFPIVASSGGVVHVAWYDSRLDDGGRIEQLNLFYAQSIDSGASFSANLRVTTVSFDPNLVLRNDASSTDPLEPFIGDYIQIATGPLEAFVIWTDNRNACGNIDPAVGCTDQDVFIAKIPLLGAVGTSMVDVYFLVDLSGSFTDDLPVFKDQAPGIISTLAALNPDIQFGLGKFEDYPIYPFGSASDGDQAYERLVDLTPDATTVLDAIAGLSTRNGLDLPQSQLAALFQTATGDGQDLSASGYPGASIPSGQQANFRAGATKLILLWTDAAFHQPGDPGDIPYPGPSFADTVNAILALDPPKVIGIASGTDAIPDLEAIAAATGSVAPPAGVDCNTDGIIDIAGGEPLVCSIALTGEGIGEAMVSIIRAATAPQVSVQKFFTDPNLTPLPTDNSGNPKVDVVLANGRVTSTNPGQLLAWVKVTNTGPVPLQSLTASERLSSNWGIDPSWIPARGGIHVFFEFANGTRLEITGSTNITVTKANPQDVVVRLTHPLTSSAGLIIGTCQPGDSVLLSVKLTYALKGTRQSARSYPRNYTDIASAFATTGPNFTGTGTDSSASGFFLAYPKVVGDVNGDLAVDLTDLILVWQHQFSTGLTYDVNEDSNVDVSDLILTWQSQLI